MSRAGRAGPRPAPGALGPGRRVYAIGDVHGCAARLQELHAAIAADLAREPIHDARLVHLGDYIDRGPDSAAVVGLLANDPVMAGMPTINLCGNHERMMLDALAGDGEPVDHWIANSAGATLRSWNISPLSPAASWRAALPPRDLVLLEGLALHHRVDGYLFVHAGVRPGIPLVRQSEEDLLWIREGFLNHRGPWLPEAPDVAIVHGHTPEAAPTVARNRIGIDTGAVNGGRLTCAVLEGRTVRFLEA